MKAVTHGHSRRRRSATRLAAVQALYEMEVADTPADLALSNFVARRWSREGERNALPEPDADLLTRLVRGTTTSCEHLDEQINSALSHGWTIERLEVLLRAILRAGAYELLAVRDVPTTIVINEYIDLTHAFFAGKEPALVNAVLDRLAVRFRAEEERAQEDDGGEQNR